MSAGFLRVENSKIVDENGKRVLLRGAALGGWLCMENFTIGYPGTESAFRAALLNVLGKEKYDYFFDQYQYHWFTDADAKYFLSLGLNCLRLPFSHKHLDDDMNPRVLIEAGFKHIDRVVDICARNGIYTILDMHTVPGCQNPDWHSDNGTAYAAFWDFKDHQDRTVWLWERIAERYRDNPWVVGYNPMNEPCDPKHIRLPAFYERVEKAIRAIDPRHILFLDGNTFAMEWKGFDKVLPNASYAIHDYSLMGFKLGPRYKGTDEQKAKLRSQLKRKCEFHDRFKTAIWNGEFGPTWESDDKDADEINACRANLLAEQIRIYEEIDMDWSIWLYKDMGRMGMIRSSPESAWNKLVRDFAQRKIDLQLDGVTVCANPETDKPIDELVAWIDKVSPSAGKTYPSNWDTKNHILRRTLLTFVADSFCGEFAELFRGKSFEELEELARSFAFENCVKRDELNRVLEEHARSVGSA
ncbi:hypothetical protein ACJ41O_009315 [Fusarium nematophilum]